MNTVLRHLRRAALLDRAAGPSDGHLLESFLTNQDEAAFEALLRRHGPMVLGVCRRVLGNRDDAEDAFQATFLVLVRKAGVIRPRELVGNWLWGVAYRTALKARAMNARRRNREKRATEMARSDHHEDWASEELLGQLDRELGRLPEKYRVPVVLCELEGRGRKEVARLLGLAEGTLSWRLARARQLLARRLARHGGVLSAGAVAAVFAQGAASAALSRPLLQATAEAGRRLAAGQTLVGTVPAKVAALTEGMMRAMLLTKLKVATWAVGVALLVGAGAVGVTYRAEAQDAPSRARQQTRAAQEALAAQEAALAARQKTRAAPDDLESLRLEIEALRKELRATRDRVKALEAEVRGRKSGSEALQREAQDALHRYERGLKLSAEREALARTAEVSALLAEIEQAAKRLRQAPDDKRAAEALDRAMRRLQQQPKRNEPGQRPVKP
jgi:RNA polymerase sigma factor (sigma-70 family)